MPQESVTQIIQSSKAQAEMLAQLEKFRRTVVVMFTDIKGSTAYFEKYGDVAGLMMVHQCNDMLRQIVEAHTGRVIKEIGDAIMATFDDCGESVVAAIEMQKSLIGFNAPKPEQDHVFIRIGLNYGTGLVKSNDVFGDVVNVASRVESVASPEQIVISDSLNKEVAQLNKFKITYLGRYALKGKEGDRDLFEVIWDEKRQARPATAHTVVVSDAKFKVVVPHFKIQHIRKDGSVGTEHEMKNGNLTIGRIDGDVRFPSDPQMSEMHAKFFVDRGQLYVEDLSGGKGVFVRLIATYTLMNGDIVMMGRQVFQFREKTEAMAAAAATGTGILEISSMIKEPVAEFVAVSPSGVDESSRFPLLDQEVTWGRNRGTYIFPEDGFMSRAHSKVYQRGDSFFLEDVGSRNGTFVKARGKSPVPAGATVLVGGQLLRVSQ